MTLKQQPFDFEETKEGAMRCRWVPLHELSADMLTFPIDKKVAGMVKKA